MVSKEALEDAVGSTVPIHTKVIANQDLLYSLLSGQPLPPDDNDHHFFLTPKQLSRSSARCGQFNDLLAFCISGTKGKRGPKQLASLKYHFQCVLLTLSWAIYCRQWVLVALDSHAYSKNSRLKAYGFNHAHTKAVVDYLEDMELIVKKLGKRYSGKPTRTRIFPTEKLQMTLWSFFLESEQPIEPPYVTINEHTGGYGEVIADLPEDHPDIADMTKINEFLKGHQWACKAPVRLVYKHDPFHFRQAYNALSGPS
jgi:hypothetical protein